MKILKPSDIFVFGYFGFVTNQIDGQTVKTRMIHRLFEIKAGGRILFYDTESLKSNKTSLIKAIWRITRVNYVIYLPAQKNLGHFLPVLFFLSRIFHFQIHYFVIGGWLPQFIEKNKAIGRKLKRISGLYVETRKIEDLLTKNFDFSNIIWFPNFRFKNPEIPKKPRSEKLRMVFLSRITKKKGIDTIFRFLDSLDNDQDTGKFQIDFYGPVDDHDKDYFYEQIKLHQSATYKGIIEPDSVQRILAGYDLLLFPTRYEGEGCPGIIIDACYAGLPVLATDWKYNSEFVIDSETGYLFDINDKLKFRKILLELVENKSCLIEMGLKAREFSKKFDSENAWKIIQSKLQTTCI